VQQKTKFLQYSPTVISIDHIHTRCAILAFNFDTLFNIWVEVIFILFLLLFLNSSNKSIPTRRLHMKTAHLPKLFLSFFKNLRTAWASWFQMIYNDFIINWKNQNKLIDLVSSGVFVSTLSFIIFPWSFFTVDASLDRMCCPWVEFQAQVQPIDPLLLRSCSIVNLPRVPKKLVSSLHFLLVWWRFIFNKKSGN
jgi:hypothetical protein